jgi:uncharacterized membrane protein YjjB (DUF3815 family)
MPDILWLALQDALWSAVAATGFAILFNVPVRTLPACALSGAVGHAARTLLVQMGIDLIPATLAGATVMGFMGLGFARYWRAPASIFTVSGAITMVPGVFAFRAMLGILHLAAHSATATDALLIETTVNGVRTALILAAIAIGIVAPGLLFNRRPRRG